MDNSYVHHIDYQSAREEYLDRLNKCTHVLAIIEFGEINCLGISDIDWLIILDDTYKGDMNHLLKLSSEMTDNTLSAFQHNPLFVPLSAYKSLNEFLMPNSPKLIFSRGDVIKIEKLWVHSKNQFLRDMTISFDFLVRLKKWLKTNNYNSFGIVKQLAVLKSIGNFKSLPTLETIKANLNEYSEEVNSIRRKVIDSDIPGNKLSQSVVRKGMSMIEMVEQVFSSQMKKHYSIKQIPKIVILTSKKDKVYFGLNNEELDVISLPAEYSFIPYYYFTTLKRTNIRLGTKLSIKSDGMGFPVEITDYLNYKVSMFVKMYSFLSNTNLNVGIVADFGSEALFRKSIYTKLFDKGKQFYKNFFCNNLIP